MRNRNDNNKNGNHPEGSNKTMISKRLLITICCIILALGMGITIFLLTRSGNNNNSNNAETTPSIQVMNSTPTVSPTTTPTVAPTITPTPVPTEVANNDSEGDDYEAKIPPVSVKGLYVPSGVAGSKSRMEKLIKIADNTEINAMVIDVKDDQGKITYSMDSDMAKDIGAVTKAIPNMKDLIQTLKDKNIYLIARIVSFKDPLLATKRPDLALRNKDGSIYIDTNGLAWVNPYKKEVWDYLVNVAEQAAAAGFDEIQFDYIRFSTGKGIDQVVFGKESGGISKEEIITEFTKYAYEKLKPLGVYVAADVFGTVIGSPVDAKRVGQDYVQMAKYLDYICPMIYPSHFGEGNFGIKYPDTKPYDIINSVLQKSKDKLKDIPESEHCAIVRPWLQDFTATWVTHHIKYGGAEIRKQIKGVYSVDYKEWLLWNAGGNYTQDGLLEQ